MEKLLKYLRQFGSIYANDFKFKNQGSKIAKKSLVIDLLPGNKGIDNLGFMEFCKKRGVLIQLHSSI